MLSSAVYVVTHTCSHWYPTQSLGSLGVLAEHKHAVSDLCKMTASPVVLSRQDLGLVCRRGKREEVT